MKVSICMATYNGAAHIERQLNSIIKQLKENDEIIISDDGSTDKTLIIIRHIIDERIKVVVNNETKGPVGNFENAIANAKGDIIFLSDQDDVWFENKIEEHVKLHQNYDVVISDAIVVDENDNVIFDSFFKKRKSRSGLISNLVKNSYIGCCMSFTSNVATQALPFPPNIHMHDWWIGLIGEVTGKVYFHNERLMKYVRHDNNASDTLVRRLPLRQQLLNRFRLFYNLMLFLIRRKSG